MVIGMIMDGVHESIDITRSTRIGEFDPTSFHG